MKRRQRRSRPSRRAGRDRAEGLVERELELTQRGYVLDLGVADLEEVRSILRPYAEASGYARQEEILDDIS